MNSDELVMLVSSKYNLHSNDSLLGPQDYHTLYLKLKERKKLYNFIFKCINNLIVYSNIVKIRSSEIIYFFSTRCIVQTITL